MHSIAYSSTCSFSNDRSARPNVHETDNSDSGDQVMMWIVDMFASDMMKGAHF